MRALCDELRARLAQAREGGGAPARRASPLRGKLPVRERIDLPARPRHARCSSSRRWRPSASTRRGARRRHRHRHRHGARPRVRDRRQRRHRQRRHVLPADGQEAPARAGDRAREPPAVHLPRRLRRRLPAAAGRGLPRPRPLRAHLLQPGAHVGGRHSAAGRRDGLVHGRRRLRARDVRPERDRAGHRHDLPGRPAAREGRDRRGGDRRGARRRRRARAHLGRGRRARRAPTSTPSRCCARRWRASGRRRALARAAARPRSRPTIRRSCPASSRPTSARRSTCAR